MCERQCLHNLSGSSVAHALLTCAFVGPHLQADHILSRLQLVLAELSLVLLGFPARHRYCVTETESHVGRQKDNCAGVSLKEPVGVSVVRALILGDSQASQSRQGPLHGCQVFT